MKATLIYIPLSFLYLVNYVGFTTCEKAICTSLIAKTQGCAQKSIQIQGCYGDQESQALQCIREVAKDYKTCDNEMIQKMLLYALKMNEQSEKIICENNLHLAFGHNEQCWGNATLAAMDVGHITVPFLNIIGCRVKRMVGLIRYSAPDACKDQVQLFYEKMFAASPCAGVTTVTPSASEKELCAEVLKLAFQCFLQSQELPRCDILDQPFYACLDRLNVSACSYFPVESGIATVKRIYNEYVKAFCKNSTYRAEMLDKHCWAAWVPRSVLWKTLFEVFGSTEACRHAKFLWKLHAETDDSECIPLMEKVDAILESDLHCINSDSRIFCERMAIIYLLILLFALKFLGH